MIFFAGSTSLIFGGNLKIPLIPSSLNVDGRTGRFYHPIPSQFVSKLKIREPMKNLGLISSHLTLRLGDCVQPIINNDGKTDGYFFHWNDEKFQIQIICSDENFLF